MDGVISLFLVNNICFFGNPGGMRRNGYAQCCFDAADEKKGISASGGMDGGIPNSPLFDKQYFAFFVSINPADGLGQFRGVGWEGGHGGIPPFLVNNIALPEMFGMNEEVKFGIKGCSCLF
jgi:hypothetical protein